MSTPDAADWQSEISSAVQPASDTVHYHDYTVACASVKTNNRMSVTNNRMSVTNDRVISYVLILYMHKFLRDVNYAVFAAKSSSTKFSFLKFHRQRTIWFSLIGEKMDVKQVASYIKQFWATTVSFHHQYWDGCNLIAAHQCYSVSSVIKIRPLL